MTASEIPSATPQNFFELVLSLSTALINCAETEVSAHIDAALAAIGQYGDKDRVYVFQFNQQLSEMTNTHEWVREGISSHKDDLAKITEFEMPWFFQMMRQQSVVSVADVAQLPAAAKTEKAEFEREHIHSILCVGMTIGGALIGFVGCDLVHRQKHWDASDIRELQIVADMIANTIARQQYDAKLKQIQAELTALNVKLQRQANEDGLTRVGNRRAFDQRLAHELRRAKRTAQRLSLLIIDVDHFKAFNDQHGHLLGDQVLQAVANTLAETFRREAEFVARFGGDEFVVLVPDQLPEVLLARTEQLVTEIAALQVVAKDSSVTVSIGLASTIPTPTTTTEHLVQQADQATYQAKANGRNQAYLLQS